ncbi:Chitinase 1 [Neolecta irregularis DAH-3]|uniref:chitinase n=1 Tax=Neolecta irregularis (strain DAH-3) TaxID=1198029 RepID=A0A1U7LNH8_NEOID|nr:Chitinase 1 [Neolecta irregularis DAH-3]|eukprot:OLL24189.1 Chitinase 1 [Neolecta irregularis DAH-3]
MLTCIITCILTGSITAFSASANTNLAVYWGQNSVNIVGAQQNLAYYCQTSTIDIIPLAFLNIFANTDGQPGVNFAGSCNDGAYFSGTQLLHCPQIGRDIQTCQTAGKKILLSLGGASGAYGFTSDAAGSAFADKLWNMFGGGSYMYRPFDSSIVDGFDLDIEGGPTTGYAAFVNQMRVHYASMPSRTFYIAAAPQCPYPDYEINPALSSSMFDFVFVQFYNNYCGVNVYGTSNFNFATWDTFAKTTSPNKKVKIFLGVPAAASAAGSGYISAAQLSTIAKALQAQYSSFGGIMMDTSQAWRNQVTSTMNYAQAAKIALTNNAIVSIPAASPPKITTAKKTTAPTKAATTLKQKTTTKLGGKVLTSPKITCPLTCGGAVLTKTTKATTAKATTTKAPAGSSGGTCPVNGGSCSDGTYACVGYGYAQCLFGSWLLRACAPGTVCQYLGGSISCGWPGSSTVSACSAITKRSLEKRDDEITQVAMSSSTAGVTFTISNVNATNFQAVIQLRKESSSLNQWSIGFSSTRKLLSADRGNLVRNPGTNNYTITSIDIQEPPNTMKVAVIVQGSYSDDSVESGAGNLHKRGPLGQYEQIPEDQVLYGLAFDS